MAGVFPKGTSHLQRCYEDSRDLDHLPTAEGDNSNAKRVANHLAKAQIDIALYALASARAGSPLRSTTPC